MATFAVRTQRAAASAAAVLLLGSGLGGPVRSQSAGATRIASSATALRAGERDIVALSALRDWDQQITELDRAGALRVERIEPDEQVPGRTHERLRQWHRGVRVFGADVLRQRNGFGQAESIFGSFHPDLEISIGPTMDAATAISRLEAGVGIEDPFSDPELVILPKPDGTFAVTWTARVIRPTGEVDRRFVDATTGALVYSFDETWTQWTVGSGGGVNGNSQKVIARTGGAGFQLWDLARPGNNTTYDMLGNPVRANAVFGSSPLTDADIAADADNTWSNPGAVDAHAFSGLTYDYYKKRFNRNGLNNNNVRFRAIVNPAVAANSSTQGALYPLFFSNAAYYGSGYVIYGVGSMSGSTILNRNFAGSLEVVAHELSHGVTQYSSNLIYQNESGALNESFSDIMGTAVEWFAPAGFGAGTADWVLGEDIRTNGIRSMVTPFTSFGHPDHYSIRYTGTGDGGGVHINSSLSNHMFYLAIIGGTHRLSGVVVTGVGIANREQIEQIVYRAWTQMLPSNATFAMARAASIQAARDLYGANSNAERAIIQAWTAVGVQ